jgi:AcrR family transcriptional regulator
MTSSRTAKSPDSKQKSLGVAESTDPRVERTRALIAAAFVALIRRRPYARIRVSDITHEAGIGRATFYAHFDSKDALLRAEMVRIVLPMLVELPGEPCLVDCTPLFAHVQHSAEIYRSLTAGPTRLVTERIMQDALEVRIAALVGASAERSRTAPTPAFVPRFVAGTLLALVAWSLELTPAPLPAELQAAYRALVGRALAVGL